MADSNITEPFKESIEEYIAYRIGYSQNIYIQ